MTSVNRSFPSVPAHRAPLVPDSSYQPALRNRQAMQQLGLLPSTLRSFGLHVSQFTHLQRMGGKMGGASDKSEIGGVYMNPQGQRMLLKQGRPERDMAEFLNGMINRSFIPDGVQVVPLQYGGSTYLASVFPPKAVDMYRFAYQAAGKNPPPDRPFVHIGNRHTTRIVDDGFRMAQGRGLEETLALRHLIGDNDVHSGNFVVQPNARGGVDRVIGIDYGWGSRETRFMGMQVGDHFGPEVHPNSVSRRLPIVGPTNHHVDIPAELRSGPAYIDQVLRASQTDFAPAVHDAFAQAAQNWGPQVFKDFAKGAGLDLPPSQAGNPHAVEQAYMQRLAQRQGSMLDYAAGMAAGLAHTVSWKGGNAVVLDTDTNGRPLVDRYITQPVIGRRIGDFVAGGDAAPKLRNHALDRNVGDLRLALGQRFWSPGTPGASAVTQAASPPSNNAMPGHATTAPWQTPGVPGDTGTVVGPERCARTGERQCDA
jgi:hypothetical protein